MSGMDAATVLAGVAVILTVYVSYPLAIMESRWAARVSWLSFALAIPLIVRLLILSVVG